MKLPKDLDPNALSLATLPGDLTLDESVPFIEKTVLPGIARSSKHKRARIRFLNDADQELPGSMTLDAFRFLAKSGRAHIAIDDGEGGISVAREPVKVN